MRNKKVLFITQAAMIAAIYVVLNILANSLGLANYAVQVRFSEALTILPCFTPAAIPGLFVGCILSNILTGCMPLDVLFGSLATLAGAVGTYLIARGIRRAGAKTVPVQHAARKWLCPLPPIIANIIVVPYVLAYVYHIPGSIPYFMLTVGAGELISCYVLGMILFKALAPNSHRIFMNHEDMQAADTCSRQQ